MTTVAAHPRTLFATFGRLLDYRHLGETGALAHELAGELDELSEAAAASVRMFAAAIEALDPRHRIEVFSRTFDLAPSCPPYISVHLFGEESFKRAILMTGLAEAYARAHYERGGELPDHLGVVLRFAPFFTDEEWDDLVRFCLPTTLVRMRALLEPSGNPYLHLVAALQAVLGADSALEKVPCSISSSSVPYPTSLCSSCSLGPSGDTGATDTATPPCPLSSLKTGSSSGAPSPGTSASW